MLTTVVGVLASICTALSYIPQLKKAWSSGETDDLSLSMLLCLSFGIALWVVYGFRQSDWVIVASNTLSLAFLAAIIAIKLRAKKK